MSAQHFWRQHAMLRFAVYGAGFGACFPLVATLLDIVVQAMPLAWQSVAAVQSTQPLHWIIDTAPISLGLTASLIGLRQGKLEQLAGNLEQLVAARTTELAQASDAKGVFLATTSHEIRTPLNSIVGMTSLLNETELTPVQQMFRNLSRVTLADSGRCY